MKVKVETHEPEFRPVDVVITLESLEEVRALRAITSHGGLANVAQAARLNLNTKEHERPPVLAITRVANNIWEEVAKIHNT